MKKILALVFVALIAAGCSDKGGSIEKEEVEGVDCIVARARNGNPRAISCDWGDE
jgi:hypothetical protein